MTRLIPIALLALTLSCALAWGGPPVVVTVNPTAKGVAVPADFSGVSYEMQLVTPGKGGEHYFSPDNKGLVGMFKTLGLKSLRVGGNTADRPTVPVPTQEDIDSLFAFAKKAGVKVIFTLRLRESAPEKVVGTAQYLMRNYGDWVTCLAAGNEPNMYARTYEGYRDLTRQYYTAIRAAAPGVMFSGPGTTPGKAEWARRYAEDFGPTGEVKLVMQHSYPGGSARKVKDVAKAREDMLSHKWVESYQKMYDAFVPAARKAGVAYRLEETNSFYNGGAKDISDTMASALWALDYMYWWASHGAAGLNFHTGDRVAAGEQTTPCRYALFSTAGGGGYDVHPIGYAIKAFDLGSHGTLVPAEVDERANVSAYAVASADHHLYVTLVNKNTDHGVAVKIAGDVGGGTAKAMYLLAPKNDLAATSGVTLGESTIGADGSWHGTWQDLSGETVDLPAASAAIVDLTLK